VSKKAREIHDKMSQHIMEEAQAHGYQGFEDQFTDKQIVFFNALLLAIAKAIDEKAGKVL